MFKIIGLVLLSVGCAKVKDKIEPIDPVPDEIVIDYSDTIDYLVKSHLQGAWSVISVKPDGSPQRQGEALIWAGTALGSMTCASGAGIERGLIDMIISNHGQLVRVDPIGEYGDGRQVTFDGAAGLLFGVSYRVFNCPESPRLWFTAWQQLMDYEIKSGGKLNDKADSRLDDDFTYLRDLIAWRVGLMPAPDTNRLDAMSKEIGAWAQALKAKHVVAVSTDSKEPACYPMNLGLLFLLGVENSGQKIPKDGRDMFCNASEGMDIPTIDHWCGRKSMAENYLPNYQNDLWEMRHQRCGAWETPDGDGNSSSRVDKLLAYRMAYRVN